MIRSFRRLYWNLRIQPGFFLFLLSLLFLIVGVFKPLLAVFALMILLFLSGWQKRKKTSVGVNFVIFQSIPWADGRESYYILCQTEQKGVKRVSCHALRSSLLSDKRGLKFSLPPGRYVTITHEGGLRALLQSGAHMETKPRYVYDADLHGILMRQTHRRCRNCKTPCLAWRGEKRKFYLLHFKI